LWAVAKKLRKAGPERVQASVAQHDCGRGQARPVHNAELGRDLVLIVSEAGCASVGDLAVRSSPSPVCRYLDSLSCCHYDVTVHEKEIEHCNIDTQESTSGETSGAMRRSTDPPGSVFIEMRTIVDTYTPRSERARIMLLAVAALAIMLPSAHIESGIPAAPPGPFVPPGPQPA
jgi:hypothetical protein